MSSYAKRRGELEHYFDRTAADTWATDLEKATADRDRQIRLATCAALGREADEAALEAAGRFLDAYRKEFVDGEAAAVTDKTTPDHEALAAWLRTLLGSNEFLHVD